MSDLVGNPEDRFSHNEAHLVDSQADLHLGCEHMHKAGFFLISTLTNESLFENSVIVQHSETSLQQSSGFFPDMS